MGILAVQKYSQFRDQIPDEFVAKGGDRVTEFKMAVGKEAKRLRGKRALQATGNKNITAIRWVTWLDRIGCDDEDAWAIIKQLNDSKIESLAGRGDGRVEYAIALYYGFHSLLDDRSFADTVDGLVFGEPLRLSDVFVFEREGAIRKLLTLELRNSNFHYSQMITKVWGREREQEKLHAFMNSPQKFSWLQLAGAGGQGKSRLAFDLVKDRWGHWQWDAGFLNERNLS